jgi:hypothetical protein
LLIKAERARINIILGSLDLFDTEGDANRMIEGNVVKQDFEEALECYTLAIESAQRYKFTHFEALGSPLLLLHHWTFACTICDHLLIFFSILCRFGTLWPILGNCTITQERAASAGISH